MWMSKWERNTKFFYCSFLIAFWLSSAVSYKKFWIPSTSRTMHPTSCWLKLWHGFSLSTKDNLSHQFIGASNVLWYDATRHVHSAKFSYASISTCERVICYDFRTTFAPAIKGFIYQPKIHIITWNSPSIEDYLALNKEQGT